MLDWLVGVLTPIFEGMGVSATDVQTYVEMMSGHIYAILAIIVAAIAVMIAAHWLAKKGTRHVVRWVAGLAGVLGVAGVITAAMYGPLYNNVAPIINGAASVSEESVAASKDVIRQIGDEGMVLLMNDDNLLPLEEGSNLNVFGWASTSPIFGGTGSGSSDSSDAVGILDSLEMAGFNLNTEITDMYTAYSPTRNLGGNVVSVMYTDWSLPEPPRRVLHRRAHGERRVLLRHRRHRARPLRRRGPGPAARHERGHPWHQQHRRRGRQRQRGLQLLCLQLSSESWAASSLFGAAGGSNSRMPAVCCGSGRRR